MPPADPEQGNDAPSQKSFLCFSLRTHVLRDAKILARRLTEMSDLVFAADAEMTMAIALETQVWMLESLARFEIEAFERTRAVAGPRSPEAAALGLRREEALQDTLRQALWLGDRDIARQPLRHVAALLGIALDEGDEDWPALAYEATKVLLDVSHERARRQQGFYDQPTLVFRRAVSAVLAAPVPHPVQHPTMLPEAGVMPAGLATSQAPQLPATPAAAAFASALTVAPPPCDTALPAALPAAPEPHSDPAQPATTTTAASAQGDAIPATPVIVPADLDCPAGFSDAEWHRARIAARPPRVLIDKKLLSEQSRAAVEKQRGITLPEAIELHYELISLGYSAPFNVKQKRKPTREDLREGTVEDRLCEDHKSKRKLALDFWPAVLGDDAVDEIPVDAVNDALMLLWRVPNNHGRSEADRGKFSLLDLIEQADATAAKGQHQVDAAIARGASAEEVDKLRLAGQVARLSISTYVKHGRVLRAVGEMLWEMQLIDHNPFSICSWSNRDIKELKSNEGARKREAWDDRINELFGSPIYQEPLEEVGEPLFWAPLIARHQGMRMEEILQLGPDDFGLDKGIPYLRIRDTIINGVKTLSSERMLPIHPQLIVLGLLKLVALRREKGHIRLFPHLTRGKQKGTFSANFSKCFGYYRRTNDCYWPGLDFHALRTTFHNDLLSDDKSDAIRCRLMGHAYTDEGDRSYGQSLGIATLAARLNSIVVDISMIQSPFADPAVLAVERASARGLRVVA